ncbi:MAG: hypothetical protein AAGJ08_20570 [Cyanobacteria bacterium P01_H01_bin.35]
MSEQFNSQQKIFSLTWLAYSTSLPIVCKGSQEYLQNLAIQIVTEVFADAKIRKLIGKWQRVWGPAIYQHEGIFNSQVSDNTMFVAKYLGDSEPNVDHYVISIAGTNFESMYDWILEDNDIATTRDWNKGQPWKSIQEVADPKDPAISNGVTRGLKNLMTKLQDQGKLLFDCLREITINAKKPIKLTVTGHSLAGSLAPFTALGLVDRKSEWDPKNIATVEAFSVAGISPANSSLAKYYDKTFGASSTRVWNNIDFFPTMMWAQAGIKKAPGLYAPHVPASIIVQNLCDFFNKVSQGNDYQPIDRTNQGYSGKYNYSLDIQNIKNQQNKSNLEQQCGKIIAYAWLSEMKKVPSVLPFVENKLEILVTKLTPTIAEYIDDLVRNYSMTGNVSDDVDTVLESKLNDIINSLLGTDLNLHNLGLYDHFNSKLLSPKQILNVVNFFSQIMYQHVDTYVEYFGATEYEQRRQEITTKVIGKVGATENKIQKPNTVIVNYGSAESDDIKDLYKGKGKIFKQLGGVMEKLKGANEVSQDAQPVVLIVKKKK